MPVEETASIEETSSGYDSAKREMANGDRVKEEVSEAEKLRRLRHALDIMESSYFDGLAISAGDQAFIEKMGGEDVILQQMLFDISRTYDKFQLMHIYFKGPASSIPDMAGATCPTCSTRGAMPRRSSYPRERTPLSACGHTAFTPRSLTLRPRELSSLGTAPRRPRIRMTRSPCLKTRTAPLFRCAAAPCA